MKNILIKIAYDGTYFNGWQTGGTGKSIENTINKAISKVLDEEVKIYGASRTDAFVSSNGNYANFFTERKINPDKIFYAINNYLPDQISILNSKEVPLSFNIRKEVEKKEYIYRIHSSKVRNPIYEHNAAYVYYDIDIDLMNEGKNYIIGTKDFKSFINPESQLLIKYKDNPSEFLTTRTIYDIDIKRTTINSKSSIIEIRVIGNGFLYHMVRIIARTLLKVGMKMYEPTYVKDIIEKKDRQYAGFTMPAHGLTLEKIYFINNEYDL